MILPPFNVLGFACQIVLFEFYFLRIIAVMRKDSEEKLTVAADVGLNID